MNISHELNGILTIAARDLLRFLRDRPRIVTSFIFPLIFIVVLGGSLQANVGKVIGYNFLVFVFTGVYAQTMFQSTAAGIISLIEDRENNFSQELFVSPISRYTLILGKILGETLVSLAQGIGVILFALIVGRFIGLNLTFMQVLLLIPLGIGACFLGGAFGVLVLANLGNQRSANQIFPLVIFPQFFLSGVFAPIKDLPIYLLVLSRLTPMTYAVDFIRSFFYWGKPEYSKVVLNNPFVDVIVVTVMFLVFLIAGTVIFIRNERNR